MKQSMRILGIVMSIVLLVSVVACSNSNTAKDTSGSTAALNSSPAASTAPATAEIKPVTLRFMWWGSDTRHNNTLATIDLYKKVVPNVTIEGEYGGWDGYQDKLTTQLAGGTAPDIMQVSYSWISDLQKKGGFFADLSKYPQLIDLGMFSDKLINAFCKVDNATVAVPAGVSAYAFLVNKDLLTKAGVTLDQKWTWDSFLDAAKKVHALGKDYYFSYDGFKETLYEKVLRPFVMARTGNVWINNDYTMGFTRENVIEAFNYIKTLNDNNAWPPVTEVASAATIVEDPRWINGKIASTLEWVSSFYPAAQAIGAAADVQIHPTLADGKDSAIASQPSQVFSVNAKSENIEEAIKFVNYMFTDDAAINTLKDCRGIPPSKKGLEVAEANKLIDPMVMKALKLAVDNGSSIPFSAISDDTELATSGQDVIEKLLFKKLTPEAAADELISAYTVRLGEMKAGK